MSTYNDNIHNTGGTSEAPPAPLWLLIIRGVQALFSLLVMALAANAASYFYADGYGMAFFTFVWTVLFLLYIFLAPRLIPQLYLFWAHIAFEATVWVFWLVTWALLADYVRGWNSISFWGRRGGGPAVDSTRAAFAFALLNWFLFCATLGITFWLSRGTHSSHHSATVDGTSSHHATSTPRTGGGGFSFANLFSRRKNGVDAEKGVGHNGVDNTTAVNETGQPVEMQNGVGNNGYNGNPTAQYPQAPDQTYQQPAVPQQGYEQPR